MILLDTNHLTVLKYSENKHHKSLVARMNSSADQDFAVPIVVVEEQLRGWLAVIHRASDSLRQIAAYDRLADLIAFFAEWKIVRFDDAAAQHFERLRLEGIRLGSMDLRIASIALANEATLITANFADFLRVPGLKQENWLELQRPT